ncbi:hypothetical protein SAY86_011092 [Trapa natans]|uniref:O-methyltransferase C-terminal domain-containing protein n=1 Tax=Trapa natans TaxID=22666 RepID=A0AAN7LMP7_TRANT|nr:hypothetical protein SAY86_011092 [Trapa natans]
MDYIQWIIHDWNDQESVEILRRCREGLSQTDKGVKVIIIDIVMEYIKRDVKLVETQLFYDLQMMVLFTGKERSEREWAKLFAEGGFPDYKITPIMNTLQSVIEVYP